MSVLTREDFFNSVNKIVGDDADDEKLKFLEDMQDTYNDMQKKIEDSEGVDWQKKYDELDKSWRAKYKHRFFSNSNGMADEPDLDAKDKEQEAMERAKTVTIDDLFNTDKSGGKEIK